MRELFSIFRKGPSHSVRVEQEYVIPDKDSRIQQSLAQQIGLVPDTRKFIKKLSEQEWKVIKRKCIERRDPLNHCPICQEEFALSTTVLLSCSHLFHRSCVGSFERYCGVRCCPLCRQKDYEKRVVLIAKSAYHHKMATRIQAAWRAYRIRRTQGDKYRKKSERNPSSRTGEEELLNKIRRLNDNMIQLMEEEHQPWGYGSQTNWTAVKEDDIVDQVLAEADESIRMSADAMAKWDNVCVKSTIIKQLDCNPNAVQLDWQHIWESHRDRHVPACPICLHSWTGEKSRVLLSCSHTFHTICLEMFETLQPQLQQLTCPICRWADYSKQSIPGLDRLVMEWCL